MSRKFGLKGESGPDIALMYRSICVVDEGNIGMEPMIKLLLRKIFIKVVGIADPLILPFNLKRFQFITVTRNDVQVTLVAVVLQQSDWIADIISGLVVCINNPLAKLITLGQSTDKAYRTAMTTTIYFENCFAWLYQEIGL